MKPLKIISVSLPLPAYALTANGSAGRKAPSLFRHKISMRDAGFVDACDAAKGQVFAPHARLWCSMVFHFPDDRRRDILNYAAGFKAWIDGACKATGCDDSQIRGVALSRGSNYSGGRVEIVISSQPLEMPNV